MEKIAKGVVRVIVVIGVMALGVVSCKQEHKEKTTVVLWEPYNDSAEVAANRSHENRRMRYKLVQSKVLDKNDVFLPLYDEVSKMSEDEYNKLKPLIIEQDIPTIQEHIKASRLSCEKLVRFYLYRIYKYELDNATTLNTIVALNPNIIAEAKALDADTSSNTKHPIYGMPILLKDNIGTENMKTTAGAIALQNNQTDDSFIVSRLKEHKALILGKVNLSEWAYFLCTGCPVGYSAVWGQTLNPYGRRIFESGGSSSGSGTSVAANYAVAAIGTETSGSILSPSSQNSVVGLKPTIGLLSRTGIVPISSTLDTPGPMTKNVIDNAILLDALSGFDAEDGVSVQNDEKTIGYHTNLSLDDGIEGKRLGVFRALVAGDSIYGATIARLKAQGAEIIEFDPPEVDMNGFLSILNIDMKNDLPIYLSTHAQDKEAVTITSIADAVVFNNRDSLVRIPYGQALFEGILADSTTADGLVEIKERLEKNGRNYFDQAIEKHNLDAILSINNYHAGFAAVAKYPALTIPMGYKASGEPISLTFISSQFRERELLQLGKAYEMENKMREIPEAYK